MSAKASVKVLADNGSETRLFRLVSVLTGSKNALKGVGFFVGAALLEVVGFRGSLGVLASMLAIVLLTSLLTLPSGVGKSNAKPKFTQVFSHIPAINRLAAARFFLFASRDVWFVVGLPVYLYSVLGWGFSQVGAFLALWIIGYGAMQASAPHLLGVTRTGTAPTGLTALVWVATLMFAPAGIALALAQGWDAATVLTIGLIAFGIVFAINSSIHSYLILAYSDNDKVSMNVGFYYMANAGGRLLGTVLSGIAYQTYGLEGCLWWSTILLALATVSSLFLPGLFLRSKAPS
jgi:predicted MFS family arabinose efflux permease